METTALAPMPEAPPALLEKVLIHGDLKALGPDERLEYYRRVCESVGLNPLTRPFEYITLQGKLTLYARRDATDQLRQIHGVSVADLEGRVIEGVYIVSASFRDRSGRTDQATGAVPIAGLKGEPLANAMMKAETKCKRRGTLSICGLGMLDETEVVTVPGAKVGEPEPFGTPPRLPATLTVAAPAPAPPLEPDTCRADDNDVFSLPGANPAPMDHDPEPPRAAELFAPPAPSSKPKDAISEGKAKRLFALIHAALRTQDADTPGAVKMVAARIAELHGLANVEHLSWRKYEAVCAALPELVREIDPR